MFLVVLQRTTLKPKLNLRLKLWKGLGSPFIDVTVKKDMQFASVCAQIFRNFGGSVW